MAHHSGDYSPSARAPNGAFHGADAELIQTQCCNDGALASVRAKARPVVGLVILLGFPIAFACVCIALALGFATLRSEHLEWAVKSLFFCMCLGALVLVGTQRN